MKANTHDIHVGQVMKQDQNLRNDLERIRGRVAETVAALNADFVQISRAVRIEYTGHVVLLKRQNDGWACVMCINGDDPPQDVPEFDLALPIPKPETMPDWGGW